jgi:peptide/nickel transport system substrate-binding protein
MLHARTSKLFAALLAGALLCACTKAQTAGGPGDAQNAAPLTHLLRIGDGAGDVPSLNPHLFTEVTLGLISQMTQAYLVKYDAQNNPVPELVTVVPTQANGGISADGKTITWHIRKGVRWSDGAPFDGDDVVFSTHVVLNPANNEVGRDGWDLITSIDEPDKFTVIYHLKKPYASFIPTFFGSGGANPTVLPKHLLNGLPNINNAAYNSKPVGIGWFRITAWKRGDSVEMEANPYYFRGLAKLKHVTYKLIPSRDTLLTLMQTGDVDLWPRVPSSYINQVMAITKLQTQINGSPLYAHLDLNVSRPFLTDVRVREAIRLALDRRSLADKITHGHSIVQESIIPPINPIAPKNIPFVEFDPAKARQLLDEAGWKVGSDGIRTKGGQRLSLEFPYYTGVSTSDDTVEYIRQLFKDVGIEIQTRKYAPALFFAPYQSNGIIYGGKWDITMFSWESDPVGELSNLFECNQIPPNGQNVAHYCNPELDKLLEQFKSTYDRSLHAKLLDQEVRMIDAGVPTIVLYVWVDGFTYSKNLSGFHPGAYTPFDNMGDVDL